MTKHILIAGGSGLVGNYLTSHLESKGHKVHVLTRNPAKEGQVFWDPSKGEIDLSMIGTIQAIVHLSGAGIVDKKWSKSRKEELILSRVEPIRFLNSKLDFFPNLETVVGISGVNCYGMNAIGRPFVEEDPYGSDFIDQIVLEWEKEYQKCIEKNIRTTVYRMGVVFTPKGGALKKFAQPIKMSIGSALGTGKQNMPWIHIEDVCGAIEFAINNETKGTFNLIGGNSSNEEVTRAISRTLGKKLWFPKVPSFMIKLLFGERSDLMLKGVEISNEKLKGAGYSFRFEAIQKACDSLLK